MDKTARVLVIRSSAGSVKTEDDRKDLISKLERFGVVTLFAQAGREETIDVVDSLPDIILLDARDEATLSEIAEISEKLKNELHLKMLPICVLTSPSNFDKFPVQAHFDERLPANVLARKIKQIIRLSFMGIEYSRRLETARSFGLNAPDFSEIHDATPETISLLFLGKGERYFQLAQVFGGTAKLKSCTNFLDAVRYLRDDNYDCLVVDSVSYPSFNFAELETLKANTKFFNLPVLLLQEGLDDEDQVRFIEGGLCDLFDLNFDAPEIATHVRTVVRSEYVRRALQEAFTSAKFSEITDVLTGLPSGTFFEKHLARLTEQSRAWNLPIAFGVINVCPHLDDAEKVDEASSRAFIGQVGRIIASLIRSEDVANYFGNGRFIIVAPNNSANSISVLLSRIAAVLEMTQMSLENNVGGVHVRTDYFISEAQSTAEQVMDRLRNG